MAFVLPAGALVPAHLTPANAHGYAPKAQSYCPGIIAPRGFNRVVIDREQGTITKSSLSEHEKIEQEIRFYSQLPERLQRHFPEMLEFGKHAQEAYYTLRYIQAPTLSHVFVHPSAGACDWNRVIQRLLALHSEFSNAAANSTMLDAAGLHDFYWSKTLRRIGLAREQSERLSSVLSQKTLRINGATRRGWPSLEPLINKALSSLCANQQNSFVHGDLCFSNILWDNQAQSLHCIDPRGEFMGAVNRGDGRYDLAKLLHSAHGGYDFIIDDQFRVAFSGNGRLDMEISAHGRRQTRSIGQQLVEVLTGKHTAAQVESFQLLEGLLFISMLPLHYDAPERQLAFAAIGLEILNRCLEGRANAPLH